MEPTLPKGAFPGLPERIRVVQQCRGTSCSSCDGADGCKEQSVVANPARLDGAMTGHGETGNGITTLDDLIGRALSGVVFVQDYLQLQFDGSVLTLLVWPVVVTGAIEKAFDSPGYRDLLCERIGTSVTDARAIAEQALSIALSDGSSIVAFLVPGSYQGPEAAIYTAQDGRTWVW